MAQALRYPTSINFIQKTLGAQLLAGATAAATLNNVTSIQNKPGVMIVDRVDTNGVETPSKREVIQFSATSGSTVTTLTRNADGGGTDQDHAVGAIVEFGPDILWAQSVIDGLSQVVVPSTGLLDTTKVVDLTTAQTLTNKNLTQPTIGDLTNAGHTHQNAAGGGTLAEAALALTDITTDDVSTTKHGFAPKAPNDTAKFLRGDATWAAPAAASINFATSGPQSAFTTTSASPVDVTGASVTIVPGAAAKVHVVITGYFSLATGSSGPSVKLVIDGVDIQTVVLNPNVSTSQWAFALSGQASVSAGSRVIKLQATSDGNGAHGITLTNVNVNVIWG